jgi:signal transduction histidine kinase
MARDAALRVTLTAPGSPPLAAAGQIAGEIAVPYVDADDPSGSADPATARFVISRSGGALAELRRDVTRWLLAAGGVTLLLAALVSAWLASRVSRPLRELAARTESIDLDALDQDFATDRTDEIGTLSRLLGAMTGRLRASAGRIRDAERRAAVGDMSRQVTHDIKNGLAPIRHVLRHLTEVAEREPDRLAGIFAERRGTLESSVGYLETLARNYGKLSPEPARAPADVNAIVRDVLASVPAGGAAVHMELDESLPSIAADSLAVRRILENLVGNAVDSLGGGPGAVTVTTRSAGGGVIVITVADTGAGMTKEQLERAFDDFHTTKPGGTGLGLSVVRRLVGDIGGSLRVATEPGAGTRFTVELGGAA